MIATELAAWGDLAARPSRPGARRRRCGTCSTASARPSAASVPAPPGPPSRSRSASAGRPRRPCSAPGRRVGAPAAALANGALVHALDFDDTHAGGLVHATAVVLPAAFAVGQQVGASGRERARGRGGRATRPSAASRPPRRTASTRAGCTRPRSPGSSRPPWSPPAWPGSTRRRRPTRSASPAARPAACSRSSAPAPRPSSCTPAWRRRAGSSPRGSRPRAPPDPSRSSRAASASTPRWPRARSTPAVILAGLGERWETTRIGIKPYPACQLSHATLDAVLDALARRSFTARRGASRSSRSCTRTRRRRSAPTTATWPTRSSAYAAKFSLPWSVAALVDRRASSASPSSRTAPSPGPRSPTWPRGSTWKLEGAGHAADAPGPGAGHPARRHRHRRRGRAQRRRPGQPALGRRAAAKFSGNAGPGSEQVRRPRRGARHARRASTPLLDAIATLSAGDPA